MYIKTNTYAEPNFKARKVSNVKTKTELSVQFLELFELDSFDKSYGEKFLKKFDLKSLYPNEKNYAGFKEWESYIRNAIGKIGEYNVILATRNKKPCGIMAFYEKDNQFNLSYLAKWNDDLNAKSCFVGKALMQYLFNKAHEKDIVNISLIPSNASPRGKNCREFYTELGFRQSANNSMNLFGANYNQKTKELDKFCEYENVNNNMYFNLEKYLL